MDSNERLEDDAIERQIALMRAEAGIRRNIVALLKDMERELIAKLSGPLTDFGRQRLTDMLADARSTIASYYVSMSNEVDLKEIAAIEAIGVSQSMQAVLTVDIAKGLPDARLRALVTDLLIEGAPSRLWWQRQGQDTAFRFSNAVRQGIAQGETNAQIIKRIRGAPGEAGVLEVSRRNAEALVRTSVQAVTAAADMATYESASEVVNGYRQVSTLDGRTTNICKAYSGATWDKEKKPSGQNKLPFVNVGGSINGVPRHWSCRSRIVPILRPLDVLPEFRTSTRASMDGPIANTITFDEWLAKKTKSFQNDALGVGRAELYRDGKITLAQLLDQSGRPLTLKELRAKYE